MPKIILKHVVSSSSEDLKNPAENLLKQESYYKWRTATKGEHQAVVVLQLEKATQIHSLDIGNNGSAFIEVLTGRSTWDPKEDYQVLLVASSFMSPAESKSGSNQMRVRMFGPENLNKAVASQKWDRIKVVCTQPYSKDEAYGLSFIQLHSPPEEESKADKKNDSVEAANFKTKIGRFTLKEESDKDEISIGSYFTKKSQDASVKGTTSLAASARDATSSLLSNLLSSSTSSASSRTTHLTTFTPKRDFTATPKREKIQQSASNAEREEPSRPVSQKETSKRKAYVDQNQTSKDVVAQKDENTEVIGSSMPPSKKIKTVQRPTKNRQLQFNKLMRKVVFVLSGYQNPERGNLRDKAVSMGAEYRPGWGSGCTHLICAFKNTPKFNQVKGKGKIVNEKWIVDCARRKERLSIKGYRIDGGGSSSDCDSDNLDEDIVPVSAISSEKERSKHPSHAEENVAGEDTNLELIPSQCPPETSQPGPSTMNRDSDSAECDTEDELKKARLAMDDDSYGGSTEDESDKEAGGDVENRSEAPEPCLPELPDYFEGKNFLLYGSFDPRDRRLLSRYITAYNGVIEDYMTDNVNFVISNDDWDDNFEEASTSNPTLQFVRPKWIFKCHEMRKYVPYNDYRIQKD